MAFSFYGNGAGAGDTGWCRLRREADGTYALFVGIPLESLRMVTADTGASPPTGPGGRDVGHGYRRERRAGGVQRNEGKDCGEDRGTASAVPSSPRARSEGRLEPLEVSAEFQADSTPLDDNGQGRPYITYTYAAHAAKVTVDGTTGQAAVEKVLAVYDTGAVINPILYEGQSEGGVAGGAGYALLEEISMDEGRVLNPSLHTYLIPTALDAPRVVTCTVPSSDGQGPFAAKGIGEPAIILAAPVVANALHAVTGLRFTSLPVTAERIRRRPGGGR